jgi:hypothetical protein
LLFLIYVVHGCSVYGDLYNHTVCFICFMYLDVKFVSNFGSYNVPHHCVVINVTIRHEFLVTTENEFDLCQLCGSNSLFMLAVGLTGNVAVGGDADTGPMAAAGEDSDYYTPEDPPTTILSPLHADKVSHSL